MSARRARAIELLDVLQKQLDELRVELGDVLPSPSLPAPARRSLRRSRTERVRKPSAESLAKVSDLDIRVARDLLTRGGKYR